MMRIGYMHGIIFFNPFFNLRRSPLFIKAYQQI
jgi:hypothetical protein